MPPTQELIATACRRFVSEVPPLAKLKLVARLELRGRGDVQVFRVQLPGPQISKGEPEDARVMITTARSFFNELASDGTVADWREAYRYGHLKIGGDPAVLKLIGTVIERHEARGRLKRVQ